MNSNTVRVNVSLPYDLVARLKKETKPRGLSKFLSEAANEKIEKERREKAFKELVKAPAAFTDVKDSSSWVRKLRMEDEKRMKRLRL